MSIRNRINARLRAIADGYDRYFAPWSRDVQRAEAEQKDYEIRLRDLRDAHRATKERIRAEAGAPEPTSREADAVEREAEQREADYWGGQGTEFEAQAAAAAGDRQPEADDWHEPGDAPGEWWAGPTAEYPDVQAWADAHPWPEPEAADVVGTIEPGEYGGYTVDIGGDVTHVTDVAEALPLMAGAGSEYARPTPANYMETLTDDEWTAEGRRQVRDAYEALSADARERYLADRAAELADADGNRAAAVYTRMVVDGISPEGMRQVADTAAGWGAIPQVQPSEPEVNPVEKIDAAREALRHAQATHGRRSPEAIEAGYAFTAVVDASTSEELCAAARLANERRAVAADPELTTAVQVTKPDGDRFVTRDSDLAGARVLYSPERGYTCELVTGYHNAEPAPEDAGPELDNASARTMADITNDFYTGRISPAEFGRWRTERARTANALAAEIDAAILAARDVGGAQERAEGEGRASRGRTAPENWMNDYPWEIDARRAMVARMDERQAAEVHAPGNAPAMQGQTQAETDWVLDRVAEPDAADGLADSFTVAPDPDAPDPALPWKVAASDGRQVHAETAGAAHEAGDEIARVDAAPEAGELPTWAGSQSAAEAASWDEPLPPSVLEAADLPVPYEMTELGAGQAVADRMNEREVGPGYMAAPVADYEAGQ